jgi:thermostable 8-oxoguanine DNA glycosylase
MGQQIAGEFDGDLNQFLRQYKYQPDLTAKLYALETLQFTQALINEIVLWKNNKFAQLGDDLLRSIENVKELHRGEHRGSEPLMDSLLNVHGVGLPMASTLLRFRNPSTFQIIDRHAYRAVYGSKLPIYQSTPRKKQIGIYFDYLDELITLCAEKRIKFETVDRVLYQFDKDINGVLKT